MARRVIIRNQHDDSISLVDRVWVASNEPSDATLADFRRGRYRNQYFVCSYDRAHGPVFRAYSPSVR